MVLDALRRQRNGADYTGQPVTVALVTAYLKQTRTLEKTLGLPTWATADATSFGYDE